MITTEVTTHYYNTREDRFELRIEQKWLDDWNNFWKTILLHGKDVEVYDNNSIRLAFETSYNYYYTPYRAPSVNSIRMTIHTGQHWGRNNSAKNTVWSGEQWVNSIFNSRWWTKQFVISTYEDKRVKYKLLMSTNLRIYSSKITCYCFIFISLIFWHD